MPLPEPKDNETYDDWIDRCMGDETMKDEFPDNKQRFAVCNRIWDEAKDDRAVVKYEATPAHDADDWDADAAVARVRKWATNADGEIDWAKYRRAFAWYDADDPEKFGSYKLPHHDIVDGRLVTHRRGVIAAMQALLGSRGGVDIPDRDRRGVYNHLARHYEQFDMEPPPFHRSDDTGERETRVVRVSLEYRAKSEGRSPGTVAGVAVRWEDPQEIAGMFVEKWARDVEINLHDPAIALWGHDVNALLGSTRNGTFRVNKRGDGLWYEIDLPDTQLGRDVAELVSRGDVAGASVGFIVEVEEWAEPRRVTEMPVRTIKRATLIEVSLTPIPAYRYTTVAMRSSRKAASLVRRLHTEHFRNRLRLIAARAGIPYSEIGGKKDGR